MPGNVPSAATNSFSPNTKAKSAEVNTNFTENVSWHSSFSYDAKHGTVFLQTSAKSADYTVLDTDGIHTILMTTGASNRTVTLPTAADNNGRILVVKKVDSGAGTCIIDGEGSETVDGSTTITLTDINEFAAIQCNGTSWYVLYRSNQTSAIDADNYTITASVGSNALTIALKTKAGNDPSVSEPVRIGFRNTTAATGDYATVNATAATSVVISSGSTLGHTSAIASPIYVYALNNSGTIELAVSTKLFDDGTVQTSTTEGGAGGADSATTLYSTTGRTSKAIRLLARLSSTQTTAGTWAAVPTEISLGRSFINNARLGKLDGLDVNSGYVGEYQEAQCSADTTLAGTYTDITGCSLSLTAGIWVVGYHATLGLSSGTAGQCALRTGGSPVVGSETIHVAGTGGPVANLSAQKLVKLTGSATYVLSGRSSDAAGQAYYQNSTGGLSNPDCSTMLWAHRIA